MSSNVIEKVEIFATGKWNGMDFDKSDISSIIAAFSNLKSKMQVPLKMGHNDDQPFTDGQPALGWVTDLFTEGNKLLARFEDVPDVVMSAIEAKLYKNISVELEFSVNHKSDFYPIVLSGVALLGADIPAVNTLADLTAFMGKDSSFRNEMTFKNRVAFTATSTETKKKELVMSDSEEVKALKLQLTAANAETEKLAIDNAALNKKYVEGRAEFKANKEVEAHRKQVEERGTLKIDLDNMVKEKKIAPFTRDGFLRDYDDAEVKGTILYTVKKMEETIDSNPQYFGQEQARLKDKKLKDEDGVNPGQIVVTRAKEYMAKHGEKSFSVAKLVVLEADLDLANRYTKMEA